MCGVDVRILMYRVIVIVITFLTVTIISNNQDIVAAHKGIGHEFETGSHVNAGIQQSYFRQVRMHAFSSNH